MRVRLIVVGRVRDAALASLVREYETRAARYWPLDVTEVREESGRTDPAQIRDREGDRLLEAGRGSRLFICDERGTSFTSREFADVLQKAREDARDVSFIIGGAYGLSGAVRAAAERRLALASWTLPHELARVVLAEQLYRAGTLVRGEPYHK